MTSLAFQGEALRSFHEKLKISKTPLQEAPKQITPTIEMSDTFHQALGAIISILKTSPGSITIQNIQRLANIYKFESFIESVTDTTKRLSIAGNILVIDIDYEEDPTSTKDQTRLLLKELKLILANNNNSFKYKNSKTDENILQNSLTNYDKLTKFDALLQQLSVLDQFSNDSFDLYDYYMKVYDALVEKFGKEEVELNYADGLKIKLHDTFVFNLANDERLNLCKLEFKDGEWQDSGVKANDIGLQVEFLSGELSIPINFLEKNNIAFQPGEKVTIFNSNDSYKNKQGLILQGFQFLESNVVKVGMIFGDNLSKIMDTLDILTKFNQMVSLVETLKKKFEPVEKLNELQQEDSIFQEFINGPDADGMEVDNQYLSVSLIEQGVQLKSNVQQLNGQLSFSDADFYGKLGLILQAIDSYVK